MSYLSSKLYLFITFIKLVKENSDKSVKHIVNTDFIYLLTYLYGCSVN